MAQRMEDLVRGVGVVLGERKRLEKVEKKLIMSLNRALGKIGYKVVAGKSGGGAGRRRAARKGRVGRPRAVRRRRRRPRGKK